MPNNALKTIRDIKLNTIAVFFVPFILSFFFFYLIGIQSCNDEEDPNIDLNNELHYDTNNNSAPDLLEGVHESAIRFESRDLLPYQSRTLSAVKIFIAHVPTDLTLRIYTDGRSNTPGNLLYEAALVGVKSNQWNVIELTSGLIIGNDGLWISLRFSLNETQRVIGCDRGPAFINGDWAFNQYDNNWRSLRNRTNNQLSVNWNIRAVLKPK